MLLCLLALLWAEQHSRITQLYFIEEGFFHGTFVNGFGVWELGPLVGPEQGYCLGNDSGCSWQRSAREARGS